MPALNRERRELIVDTAVAILAESGAGRLTHRRVDTAAGLPPGTTSNFHRSRTELLSAAARRVAELHWQHVVQLKSAAPAIDRASLVKLLGHLIAMPDEATHKRTVAMFELFLEGTRTPELQPILDDIYAAVMESAETMLRASGLKTDQDRLHAFARLLRGLAIDRLAVPHQSVLDLGQTSRLIAGLLDAVFGPDEAARKRPPRPPGH